MPEGTLQLEHLMQATKLLQLKKVRRAIVFCVYLARSSSNLQATAQDIEIIYDVCWMLSPSQIQRMCTNYFVADYEVRSPIYVLGWVLIPMSRILSRLKYFEL